MTRTPPERGKRAAGEPTGEIPPVRDGAPPPQPGGRRKAERTGPVPSLRSDGTFGAPGGSGGRRIKRTAPVSEAAERRAVPPSPPAPAEPPAEQGQPAAPTQSDPSTALSHLYAPPVPVTSTPHAFPRDPAAPVTGATPPSTYAAPILPTPTHLPSTPIATPASGVPVITDVPTAPEPPAPVPAPTPYAADPHHFPTDPSAPVVEPEPEAPPTRVTRARSLASRVRLVFWSLVAAAGVVLLAMAALHTGPSWADGAGAVLVSTTYTWAVLARTGGRQLTFSLLALAIGTTAVVGDVDVLRSGAAVMTCVVSGVLAVLLTVPARSFLQAVREVVVATAVASVGAFATIGFEPVASLTRFNYVTLGIGFVVMLMLVWRLAAGLHGLGTRGLYIVVTGTFVLAMSIVYTELLRRFGGSEVLDPGTEAMSWLRDTVGAAPRPIVVFLGIPALLWGVHMRARRRQGWWVCTFGVTATLPVAQRLVTADASYVEAGLQTAYSLVLGVAVGWLVIRVDQALTGTRGARARAAEQVGAVRPEPPRFSAL